MSPPPFVVGELAGHGVRLVPLASAHVAPLVACARAGDTADGNSYRFTTVPVKGVGMDAYVAWALAEQEAGRAAPFVVVATPPGEAAERAVGSTRFAYAERWAWPGRAADDHHVDALEIGWTWLEASAQRTPVNTTCKLLLLTCAFERLGVRRVTLKTDARNARSRAAIERIGARLDGVLRAHMPASDGAGGRDSAFFSILSAEWPACRAPRRAAGAGAPRCRVKIVVTGASGHLGTNLVQALIARGEAPRIMAHASTVPKQAPVAFTGLETITGDVRDPASLERAFAGAEVVYHLAGFISLEPREAAHTRTINVDGVRHVVSACLAQGVRRLVHYSSIHAFSPVPHDQPLDETRALVVSGEPVPHYDLSKADGEREIAAGVARGLDAVTVNPGGVLGPEDYAPSRMGEVLLQLYRGRMPGLVNAGFNWVDARDVAAAAIAAAERGRQGERYLLISERATMPQVAQWVAEQGGRRPPRITSPMWLARASAPVATALAHALGQRPLFTSASLHALRHHLTAHNDKARRELGFTPRTVKESIADSLACFRKRGMI